MSLTNDMLNNLEKRHSLNSDQESIFNGLEAVVSNKSYYLTYALYISSIFILLSGIIAFLYTTLNHFKSHATYSAPTIIKVPAMHFGTSSKMPPNILAQTNRVAPVKIAAPESIRDRAMQEYQEALTFIAQNQASAAIEKLKQVVGIAPNYQDARAALATLYLENNQVADAIQLLTDGLAIEPNNLPLTLLFSRALMMEGRNQAALLALNNISNIAGNNSSYVDLLASVQESLGHYSEAISLYHALLHQDPTNERWLISLGTALEHTGQKSAALSAYKKANSIGGLPPDLQDYVTNRIHHLDN